VRTVHNVLRLVQEHLEAMQRDVYGLEYGSWKDEVDGLWRGLFEQIGRMSAGPQRDCLEMVRDQWTAYVTHYVSTDSKAPGAREG
jgi:hypothetical protein